MTPFQIIEALTFKPVIRLTEILAVIECVICAVTLIPAVERACRRVKGVFFAVIWSRPGYVLCCLLVAHASWAIAMLGIWLAFDSPQTAENWCGNAGT